MVGKAGRGTGPRLTAWPQRERLPTITVSGAAALDTRRRRAHDGAMSETLTRDELVALVRRVFRPRPGEAALAILVDLPDAAVPDTPAWRTRRELAAAWAAALDAAEAQLGLATRLVLYRNVRANNADLPSTAWRHAGGPLPASADALDADRARPMDEVLRAHPLVLAPTQFSTTAPLKLAAPRLGLRAATMPGFTAAMIPALRLDYGAIGRRVARLADLLDRAEEARLVFLVDGATEHALTLDLRHRGAHASSGLITEPGTAGNLPSGEAYIVPYEGERPGDPSRSVGTLPVELEGEVVLYRIADNRARAAGGAGPVARAQGELLAREPAYGNLAELGLGVLGDLGLEPTGEVLLDEKLGLHIAFGRSDHFGGHVGARDFSGPAAVVHIDRVYVPRLQPRVAVARADLVLTGGTVEPLMRDGRYVPGALGE
jgi:hypothetical protein